MLLHAKIPQEEFNYDVRDGSAKRKNETDSRRRKDRSRKDRAGMSILECKVA